MQIFFDVLTVQIFFDIKVKNTLEKNYDHEFTRMRETTGTLPLENQMQVG